SPTPPTWTEPIRRRPPWSRPTTSPRPHPRVNAPHPEPVRNSRRPAPRPSRPAPRVPSRPHMAAPRNPVATTVIRPGRHEPAAPRTVGCLVRTAHHHDHRRRLPAVVSVDDLHPDRAGVAELGEPADHHPRTHQTDRGGHGDRGRGGDTAGYRPHPARVEKIRTPRR